MSRRPNPAPLLAACLAAALTTPAQAAPDGNHGWGYAGTEPYTGDAAQALRDAAAKTTIPLATINFTATKNGTRYADTIVGPNPFNGTFKQETINVLIVPVIVQIGAATFDPTAPDTCLSPTITPIQALEQSPLFRPVAFDGKAEPGHAAKINGVNIGKVTYPEAMRLAEFWSKLHRSAYAMNFNITTATPWTINAATVTTLGGGNVLTTGCASLGVLSLNRFQAYIRNVVIPGIPAISPVVFPLFVMKNIVTTPSSTLNCNNGCEIGYHSAAGTPVQTWGVSEFDTTAKFWGEAGITNISVLAHEFGEWLDDPLVTNPTPPWGGIGQVEGCQTNWEVGDPLTGTDFPAITMANGLSYDPQELAFFSWYYASPGGRDFGAGKKYSMNGTFAGPSEPCPPGGTF